MKNVVIYFSILLFVIVSTREAYSFMLGDVSIHGFGGWAYGTTDNENSYLVGDEDGSYDHVNFSLNVSANPYEKLSLYVQTGYNEDSDEDEIELDYAFAEWFISDALIFRVGKIKAPFMLYTEVYDVGTLRPFFTLPQGIYREVAAEAYKGVGITGSFFSRGDWEFSYDLYGGELSLLPNPFINPLELETMTIEPKANDLVGGRVTVQTPIDGFSVSFSSYTGRIEFVVDDEYSLKDIERYIFLGSSLEYLTDRLWLRSEFLTQRKSSQLEVDIAYVEAAYKLTNRWQLATRYEYSNMETSDTDFQMLPESFWEHKEFSFGVNYWFNPNLVAKCSYHIVDGNRFAIPEKSEDLLEVATTGKFDEKTNLFLIGIQFSF